MENICSNCELKITDTFYEISSQEIFCEECWHDLADDHPNDYQC